MTKKTLIAPSILSANFANLGQEISSLEQAGADLIHFDVMDGHFVPNITFGMPIVKALRPFSKLPFDVHLMIERPENYIESFAHAGAEYITVHAEAVIHLDRVLTQIRSHGIKAGVSIVPSTHESVLEYVYDKVDLILVMSVNPGFGGQTFMDNQLKKINNIREKIDQSGRQVMLAVDGGINTQNASRIVQAGADILIAGNAIFNGDYAENIYQLRNG